MVMLIASNFSWEWFTSLDFDWKYITGKKTFRWPMVFYFLNRYCLLFALMGIAIALNVTTEIDCQGLYTFNSCFGNAAIGLASINLSLRTIAVWSQRWYIVVPLVGVILGHWSLLLHGILLKAAWVPGQGCVITSTDNHLLAITFIYTMVFDFTVLCLTAFKLVIGSSNSSRLVSLIFHDGLIYFAIAFLANLIATIFMLLNLNPVMSIIANVPAAIASTIPRSSPVALFVVYQIILPKGLRTSTQGSTLAFRSGGPSFLRPKISTKVNTAPTEGVHVQMETFESPSDKSYMEYDASGNIVKSDSYDPEAQVISSEFKRPPY
ncbi:hypothetical protein DXG01_011134 [Tephrocybe rancida]|nr:hypothetical protein DXG01_011134 [Tephrocybe rancida]